LQVGFLYRRHLYCYFGTFDITYSSFQSGKLETADTLKWAFENEVDTFYLMPPADDYKQYWARHVSTVQVFISHATAWSRIGQLLYNNSLRNSVIGFYRCLPRSFRRFVVRVLPN
jgi:CelD/BcsL family acetyltransferase involved in cellulose biosynthesis